MSESKSGRKRRKPAKPSRHSPSQLSADSVVSPIANDQPSLFTSAESSHPTLRQLPVDVSCDSGSSYLSKLVASQNDIDSYITDKRSKLSSPDDSESRSGSPQDSLDLSIGSRSQISPRVTTNSAQGSFFQTDSSSNSTRLIPKTNVGNSKMNTRSNKNSSSPVIATPPVCRHLSSPVSVVSPTLTSANSSEPQSERSIMTQYEELKSKAMTSRARRIIANARERNRVHTISSAFEQLRKSIPCYSGNQKLSKLAILKIATSYIRCLSHVANKEDADSGMGGNGDGCGNVGKDSRLSELVMKCTVNVLSDGKLKRSEVSSLDPDRLAASDGEDDLD